ncbi:MULTISPECIES: DUF5518 domain-containing protein [Halolamina]|uniref:DUF5518 domain-containing protein n=1 Tax=Halolamina pelagica TaxID=699431 RepID=A0A1I5TZY0_9EURY|nr:MULTISPECIES: DUF5518 domain-containing protein [Halolamina]NHX36725.1 DUF5518 domain-containing protein [Halolamina sp. R1-12]SFP88603.1 hypothetical protein SAMN05216277_11141 [Halolamina pelagica]
MDTGNSYVNALLGAAVTIVFSFAGVSPLLGGAAAGFLERRDGARIGALAGLFAALPMAAVVVLFGGFAFLLMGFGEPFAGGVVILLFAVLFVAVYTVALSTVGGVLGVYLAEEFRD